MNETEWPKIFAWNRRSDEEEEDWSASYLDLESGLHSPRGDNVTIEFDVLVEERTSEDDWTELARALSASLNSYLFELPTEDGDSGGNEQGKFL